MDHPVGVGSGYTEFWVSVEQSIQSILKKGWDIKFVFVNKIAQSNHSKVDDLNCIARVF